MTSGVRLSVSCDADTDVALRRCGGWLRACCCVTSSFAVVTSCVEDFCRSVDRSMEERCIESRVPSLIVPPRSRLRRSMRSFMLSLPVAAALPPPSDTVRETALACEAGVAVDDVTGADGVRRVRAGVTSGVGDGDSLDSSDVRLRLRRWRMRSPIVSGPEVDAASERERIIWPRSV